MEDENSIIETCEKISKILEKHYKKHENSRDILKILSGVCVRLIYSFEKYAECFGILLSYFMSDLNRNISSLYSEEYCLMQNKKKDKKDENERLH